MSYEVVNKDLMIEACGIGDLTLDQIERFLRLWGDDSSISTLTLFAKKDGAVVLNKDNPKYEFYKDLVENFLQLEEEERKTVEVSEGVKETIDVLEQAIEGRKENAILEILKYSILDSVPYKTIEKIFEKYESGIIGLCQIFNYGVIEGKRQERAKRHSAKVTDK